MNREIDIIKQYKWGELKSSYEKTKLFCPECGHRGLYVECGPGDYYEGSEYVCIKCGNSTFLPGGGTTDTDTLTRLRKFDSENPELLEEK